ncbi:response regulator [Spirosoma sp. HMF4905]|uniref:Response regulator n=1 Tax=Spirosoma arboris TaxID=2682092 RepID=A0A7K1SIL3_9BACT|nr:response regulator [Spirosoma arboris]MVM33406.1 response regulator [Spirosoma arboris]
MPTKFAVLVVDDDLSLQTLLSKAAKKGFPEASFTQVANVDQAKEYFSSLSGPAPRLVLLDIHLNAAETGFAFLSYLRADKRNNALPVIMLTVSEASSDIRKAYENGVNSFAIKPFKMSEWEDYLAALRTYWFETVTLPTIYFNKED